MDPRRGWIIASSSWNFLQKRWLDQEQELITVIQEETKRTEEKIEAGIRSPWWSILRALQRDTLIQEPLLYLCDNQREIMLFIGKPKGRSMMISNATNPLKESRKNLY